MQVPFIDLKRTAMKVRDEVLSDWARCLDETMFVGGSIVSDLDQSLSAKLDGAQVLTCSNGTDALVIALQALGLKPGMKVAVPNMTFWATIEAVVLLGGVPVFIDLDPEDLQLSLDELKNAHAHFELDMVVSAHLFGWATRNLHGLRSFCADQGLPLLEDGAQAFGVTLDGESVFKEARAATLSFYPAKVLGASGDAGAITSNDSEFIETCRTLINHGRSGHYSYVAVGWNARMGTTQAAYLSRCLALYEEMVTSRKAALEIYRQAVASLGDKMRMYLPPSGQDGNAYLAVMTSTALSGEQMVAKLKEYGVGAARTYPEPMHIQPALTDYLKVSELAHSQRFSEQVFNLPLFAYITEEEASYVAETLVKIIRQA